MKRFSITPRENYGAKLQDQGLSFYNWDNYWREDVCYQFSLKQVEQIESATEELHGMCMEAARFVVKNQRLGQLGIPQPFWDAIASSLNKNEFSLYGRFDLAYDGVNPPKMLEYNADTPTSLLESAVCQWYWLEEVFPQLDQFNSLHEKLVARWKSLNADGPIHVCSLDQNEEDWVCSTYLMETITQAGNSAIHLPVESIGYNQNAKSFVGEKDELITTLFKLYPWEWMLREQFGEFTKLSNTQFVEPIWKSILSCKGLLPILWELYPGHPNLLECYFSQGNLTSFAKKPLYSREGANVTLQKDGHIIASDDGPYGNEGYIYQQLVDIPCFDGRYPIIGSWVVGDESAGMCLREDVTPITTNMSNFIPHIIKD